MNNKKPIRQCISCRNQFPREHFVRIVKVNDESSYKVVLNPNRYQLGRSIYICKKDSCIDLAVKAKKIEKMLKVKSVEDIADKLKSFSLSREEAA